MANKISLWVVLKKYHQRKKLLFVFILFFLPLLMAAFFLGYRYGFVEHALDKTKYDSVKAERDTLQMQLDAIRLEVSVVEQGNEITRMAAENVRLANKKLRQQMLRMTELLTLYREVMDSDQNKQGLQIERFSLEAIGERRFHYGLILVQFSENKDYVDGLVSLELLGTENGQEKLIPLAPRSGGDTLKQTRFYFRYFEELGGEIQLPKDFNPQLVKITAVTKGRELKVTRDFPWRLDDDPGVD